MVPNKRGAGRSGGWYSTAPHLLIVYLPSRRPSWKIRGLSIGRMKRHHMAGWGLGRNLQDAGDEDLMDLVAGGDERALSELYDRYSRPVYATGLRLLGDKQLAEELVQDAFTSVWRSAASFDQARASFATWLYRIARNRATDLDREDGSGPGQRASTGSMRSPGTPSPRRPSTPGMWRPRSRRSPASTGRCWRWPTSKTSHSARSPAAPVSPGDDQEPHDRGPEEVPPGHRRPRAEGGPR